MSSSRMSSSPAILRRSPARSARTLDRDRVISTGCAGCICPRPGKAQDIVRHHRLIVKAIGANQPDDAQRHLRKHLSGTLGYLAEIREGFPEYLSE